MALHVGPRLDADERITEAIKLAADRGIPVVEAGRAELDRFTGGAIHQGLALRIRPYSYAHADDLIATSSLPLVVALDGVTDPRNLGAIARSVAAFGGDGVLVPARRSAGVTAGAWKASAGALARVRVAQASNLSSALAAYAKAGLFIVGLDADSDTDIGSLDLATGPLVLVIGSEGKGLSRLVSQHCDQIARIPITGAESLNASVAAGIALYQITQLRAAADGLAGRRQASPGDLAARQRADGRPIVVEREFGQRARGPCDQRVGLDSEIRALTAVFENRQYITHSFKPGAFLIVTFHHGPRGAREVGAARTWSPWPWCTRPTCRVRPGRSR